MLGGNVAWEFAEILRGEVWHRGGLGGWYDDTVNDMAAVLEGYDSGASDCDHAFIPEGCTLNTKANP